MQAKEIEDLKKQIASLQTELEQAKNVIAATPPPPSKPTVDEEEYRKLQLHGKL